MGETECYRCTASWSRRDEARPFTRSVSMASSKLKYETCSLQIKLPDSFIEKVQEWSRRHISDELLYDDETKTYGRDTHNHITLSLGLRDDEIDAYAEIVSEYIGSELSLTNIGVFEMQNFDVIFLEVQEDDVLTQLYNKITPMANKKYVRRSFKPHVSIAFVRRGLGKKIVKQLSWHDRSLLEKFEFTLDEVELVTREGQFVPIRMKG